MKSLFILLLFIFLSVNVYSIEDLEEDDFFKENSNSYIEQKKFKKNYLDLKDEQKLIELVKSHIKSAVDYLENINNLDNSRLILLINLKKVDTVGKPMYIYVGNEIASLLFPLISKDKWVTSIYINPENGKVIEWPMYFFEKKFDKKAWEKDRKNSLRLSSLFFRKPNKNHFLQIDGFKSFLNHGVVTLIGKKIEFSQLKDFHIIDKALELPVKNMEENYDRLKFLKKKYNIEFHYQSSPRISPYNCMQFAVSNIIDWWKLQYDNKIDNSYINFYNGLKENGFNPRILTNAYFYENMKNPRKFFFTPFVKDEVTLDPIVANISALCSYITSFDENKTIEFKDFRTDKIEYKFNTKDFYMTDAKLITIFKNNRGNDKDLVEALDKFGIVISGQTQTFYSIPFHLSVHTVAIIGYKKINGQYYYLYRENYGNFNEEMTENGGPLYRIFPIGMFNEAYAFSHPLNFEVNQYSEQDYQVVIIRVKNSHNGLVDLDKIFATFKDDKNHLKIVKLIHVSKGVYKYKTDKTGHLKVVCSKKYFFKPDKEPYILEFDF